MSGQILPAAVAGADAALVASLAEILAALTTPDTAVVRTAERSLRAAASEPTAVLPLAALAGGRDAPHSRHLAAVLLRRGLRAHWPALAPEARAAVKAALLAALPAETETAPRRGLAAAAAAVCRAESTLWPELTVTAVTMSRAPDPFVRIGAFKVFDAVADAVPGLLAPHAPTVASLIASGLQDADHRVRMAALDAYATSANAVSVYAESEEPWKAIGALVPSVAIVARAAATSVVTTSPADGAAPLTNVDADEFARILCVVFDVFATLSESGGGAVMRPHFADTFRFAVEIAAPPAIPMTARQAATEYVCSCLQAKPKTLKKAGLAKLALQEAMRMALVYRPGDGVHGGNEGAVADNEDAGDDDDDEDLNGMDLALRIAYTAASRGELNHLVFSEVMANVPRMICGDLSAFALPRAPAPTYHPVVVAYRLIAAIAEGCAADFTAHVEDITSRLAAGVMDASAPPRTREAALEGIASVVSALDAVEITDETRARVARCCFEVVLAGVSGPTTASKRAACIALEPVLELFDDDGAFLRSRVADILSPLDRLAKDAPVEAVSSVAVIAENIGSDFLSSSSYHGVVEGMAHLMSQTSEEALPARAAATQAASVVISACRNRDIAERLGALAIQGFATDDAGLSEATFAFFAKMAETYGGRVAALYGSQVLSRAIASANREDIVFTPDEGQLGGLFGPHTDDAEGSTENGGGQGIDDGDDDRTGSFGVRTALLDEKAMATWCIGAIATAVATKEFAELALNGTATSSDVSSLLSLLNSAGECLDPMVTYFHEEVRAAGCRADVAYALAAEKTRLISPQLAFGAPDATERAVQRLLATIQEDEDTYVASVALHCCATFCTKGVPDTVNRFKDRILQALVTVIDGNASCQLSQDDEGSEGQWVSGGSGEDGDDGNDGDEVATLIDGICEVLSGLARCLRGHFALEFRPLCGKVLDKLITPRSLPRNNSLVIGMLADVFLFLNWKRCPGNPERESALAKTTAAIVNELMTLVLPLAINGASGNGGMSKTLRRNSVFLLGVLFEAAPSSTSGIWSQASACLTLLESIANTEKGQDGALVDNAVGAISRIMISPTIPHGLIGAPRNGLQVVLSAVPLQDDPAENLSVARAVIAVASVDFEAVEMMSEPAVSCLVSAILVSLQEEAENGKTSDEIDPNDVMTRFDIVERLQAAEILREIRKRCGDRSLLRLKLSEEDQAALQTVLA